MERPGRTVFLLLLSATVVVALSWCLVSTGYARQLLTSATLTPTTPIEWAFAVLAALPATYTLLRILESVERRATPPDVRACIDRAKNLEREAQSELESFKDLPTQVDSRIRIPRTELISRLFEEMASSKGYGIWALVGEPGTGKSTVLFSFLERCIGRRKFLFRKQYLVICIRGSQLVDAEKNLCQLLGCKPDELKNVLNDYKSAVGRQVVVVADALDEVATPMTAREIARNLRTLAQQAFVICASRKETFKQLLEGALGASVLEVKPLTKEEVRRVVRDGQKIYRVIGEPTGALLDLCRIPLLLYLWLQVGGEKGQLATSTSLINAYHKQIIDSVGDAGEVPAEEFRSAKRRVLSSLARQMLVSGSHDVLYDEIAPVVTASSANLRAFDVMRGNGTVREVTDISRRSLRFFHLYLSEFEMADYLLSTDFEDLSINNLVERSSLSFYWPILVQIARLALDRGLPHYERDLYKQVIRVLDRTKKNRTNKRLRPETRKREMDIAWGITYALRDLVDIWHGRFLSTLKCPVEPQNCKGLIDGEITAENYQVVASTLASIFCEDESVPFAESPWIVEGLIECLDIYHLKKRFVDALGISNDKRAADRLLALLRENLQPGGDKYLLANIALALRRLHCREAIDDLKTVYTDANQRPDARREAKSALFSLTRDREYREPLPYTEEEMVEALQTQDPRDPELSSDWQGIRDMAEFIREQGQASDCVLDALLGALEHEHEGAKHPVIEALGAVGTPVVFEHLLKCVEIEDCQWKYQIETSASSRIRILDALEQLCYRGQATLQAHQIRDRLANIVDCDDDQAVRRRAQELSRHIR